MECRHCGAKFSPEEGEEESRFPLCPSCVRELTIELRKDLREQAANQKKEGAT